MALFSQPIRRPITIVTWSQNFSRLYCRPHVFASSSDWSIQNYALSWLVESNLISLVKILFNTNWYFCSSRIFPSSPSPHPPPPLPYWQGNIVAAQSSNCFLRLDIKEKFIRATEIYMNFLSHNNNNVSFVIWISKTNRFSLQGLGCK